MTRLPNACPKPKPKRKPKPRYSSIPSKSGKEKIAAAKQLQAKRRPIAKKKRSPSEFNRIYGSKSRVAWVKSQPCCAITSFCSPVIENAHITTGGTGRKADAKYIVPLCAFHHAALHRMGRDSFEDGYGLSLSDWAARTDAAWQKFSGVSSRGKA